MVVLANNSAFIPFRSVSAIAVLLEPSGQRLLEVFCSTLVLHLPVPLLLKKQPFLVTFQIHVFSDTGCVLGYVCDGRIGGEAR